MFGWERRASIWRSAQSRRRHSGSVIATSVRCNLIATRCRELAVPARWAQVDRSHAAVSDLTNQAVRAKTPVLTDVGRGPSAVTVVRASVGGELAQQKDIPSVCATLSRGGGNADDGKRRDNSAFRV